MHCCACVFSAPFGVNLRASKSIWSRTALIVSEFHPCSEYSYCINCIRSGGSRAGARGLPRPGEALKYSSSSYSDSSMPCSSLNKPMDKLSLFCFLAVNCSSASSISSSSKPAASNSVRGSSGMFSFSSSPSPAFYRQNRLVYTDSRVKIDIFRASNGRQELNRLYWNFACAFCSCFGTR